MIAPPPKKWVEFIGGEMIRLKTFIVVCTHLLYFGQHRPNLAIKLGCGELTVSRVDTVSMALQPKKSAAQSGSRAFLNDPRGNGGAESCVRKHF